MEWIANEENIMNLFASIKYPWPLYHFTRNLHTRYGILTFPIWMCQTDADETMGIIWIKEKWTALSPSLSSVWLGSMHASYLRAKLFQRSILISSSKKLPNSTSEHTSQKQKQNHINEKGAKWKKGRLRSSSCFFFRSVLFRVVGLLTYCGLSLIQYTAIECNLHQIVIRTYKRTSQKNVLFTHYRVAVAMHTDTLRCIGCGCRLSPSTMTTAIRANGAKTKGHLRCAVHELRTHELFCISQLFDLLKHLIII